MKIFERYATAINASSLKPDPNSVHSDLDVIGAAGLAARYEPMGIALARMLGGGRGNAIEDMADAAYRRSHRIKGGRLTRLQAEDMAKAVLAWIRNGRCTPCGGIGAMLIPGTPSLGDECNTCKGSGKLAFDTHFRQEWRDVADWLRGEVERSQANAGTMTMQKIA